MRTRILHLWEALTSSFWFLPGLMLIASGGLSFLLLYVDEHVIENGEEKWWLYKGGVEGTRQLLATIGGSIITVAGVVFSITIVALTQASSQFGPRLLRTFMDDKGNQIVLGTFVSTFLYCILVLREVRGGEDISAFVPHLSTTVALGMAVASLCVLIYFIHHISLTIQAPQVVARVVGDLQSALDRMFPEDLGKSEDAAHARAAAQEPAFPESFAREAVPIAAPSSGYVQAIDSENLMEIATERDLRMQMSIRPGRFVVEGHPLVRVWPPARLDDRTRQRISETFLIGRDRTPEQDAEFVIDQLVEIALRALSPSVNDPFTAMNCLEWLAVALTKLARNGEHTARRVDANGEVRMIVKVFDFSGFTDEAFHQIRQAAADKPAVLMRMLEIIGSLARSVAETTHREALRRHAGLIMRQCDSKVVIEEDRRDLEGRHRAALEALQDERSG